MRKVIDVNYYSDPKLQDYFNKDNNNKVVFTELACMESYKGNSLKNLTKSLEIVSQYPERVIILKGSKNILTVDLRDKGLQKRLIDKRQTRDFNHFCQDVKKANKGDKRSIDVIKKLGLEAKNHFEDGIKNGDETRAAMSNYINTFNRNYTEWLKGKRDLSNEIKDKIESDILMLATFLLKQSPELDKLPTAPEVRNHILFRYAISQYLLLQNWAAEGGIGDVSDKKLSNDLIDMSYSAYATYFDGLLTNDSKLMNIYKDTLVILNSMFK